MTQEAKKKIEKGGDPVKWLKYLIKQLKRAEEISKSGGILSHPIKVTSIQIQLYELRGIRNNFVMLLSILKQLDPKREPSEALSNAKESVIQTFIAALEKKYTELARLAKLLKDWNDPALMARNLLEIHYPTREVNVGRNEENVKRAGVIKQKLEKISKEPSFFDNLYETRELLRNELQVISKSEGRDTSGYFKAVFEMTEQLEAAEVEIFNLREQIQKEWPSKIEDNLLTFTPPSTKKVADKGKSSTIPESTTENDKKKMPPLFKGSISSSHVSPAITSKILFDKKINSKQEPPKTTVQTVTSSSQQDQRETTQAPKTPQTPSPFSWGE
ncbi:MAG TPA: hypothetical protein VHE99_08520 [Gammaproteobacteria bacterium]|nr:hypothetical protein [Gammaproteobacteria bacterium]